MKCPECGHENAEDVIFCDDCGVVLAESDDNNCCSSQGGLELGDVLDEHWKVSRVIHYDSRCALYEVENMLKDGVGLVVEGHSSRIDLERWCELRGNIDNEYLWCPSSIIEHGERFYALGPWIGEPLCEKNVELSPVQIARAVVEILSATETLRGLGWQCCFITPQSIFWNEGKATLLSHPKIVLDSDGNMAIVEGFSAPEMFGLVGGIIDEKTDIYGVGALLYYLVNRGELNIKRLGAGCLGFPNVELGPKSELMEIVAKALQREPSERYESLKDMRFSLEEAIYRLENPEAKLNSVERSENNNPDSKITQPLPYLYVDCSSPKNMADVGSKSNLNSKATQKLISDNVEIRESSTDNKFNCEVAHVSNVGAVRTVNQDAFVEMRFEVCERDVMTEVHFLAVVDGMGGEAEGDKAASIASRVAVREVLNGFLPLPDENVGSEQNLPIEEHQAVVLRQAMSKANSAILDYASEDSARRGMGCTTTMALINRGLLTIAHAGDTRAYIFDGDLKQISRDHSVVGQLVEMGALTKEQARHSPKRSIIYRALGTDSKLEIEIYQCKLRKGDYLFLASDGVWEYYSDEELKTFFSSGDSPQAICEKLIATCLDRGADDNTTSVVFRYI